MDLIVLTRAHQLLYLKGVLRPLWNTKHCTVTLSLTQSLHLTYCIHCLTYCIHCTLIGHTPFGMGRHPYMVSIHSCILSVKSLMFGASFYPSSSERELSRGSIFLKCGFMHLLCSILVDTAKLQAEICHRQNFEVLLTPFSGETFSSNKNSLNCNSAVVNCSWHINLVRTQARSLKVAGQDSLPIGSRPFTHFHSK